MLTLGSIWVTYGRSRPERAVEASPADLVLMVNTERPFEFHEKKDGGGSVLEDGLGVPWGALFEPWGGLERPRAHFLRPRAVIWAPLGVEGLKGESKV